jgi:hypothetical protein
MNPLSSPHRARPRRNRRRGRTQHSKTNSSISEQKAEAAAKKQAVADAKIAAEEDAHWAQGAKGSAKKCVSIRSFFRYFFFPDIN